MNNARKPNFFIVGAPKCGTTAMFEYLRQHPDIFMYPYKESNFFADDLKKEPHGYSQAAIDKYLSRFKGIGEEAIVGDASIWHLYSKAAPIKIKEFNPGTKILIMLRNPVEQMHSLHSQLVYGGIEPLTSFQQALQAEAQRKIAQSIDEISPDVTNLSYKCLLYREIASFSAQVSHYLDIFGTANVHIVLFDELKQDAEATYERVLDFLNIEKTYFSPEFRVFNSNKVRRFNGKFIQKVRTHPANLWLARTFLPPLAREVMGRKMGQAWSKLNSVERPRVSIDIVLKKKLLAEFTEETKKLGQLLNRDLSSWLIP
ncbi:sulfotransferase [Nodosilinea sp. LEGE 07088]|uniref:sulfotransferase family protein n=1 Tax=Nodosilinea sp. LEGE 07088 TaxID=2777968 RepID=UPI00187F29BD|nr:sulfotransferase [Nodosilinea sp. LEGE 07088]MBE9135948.1 sulfotransferase [Nodosilinea sp. LEGE 07088]